MLAAGWHALSEADRRPFEELAQNDKARYLNESGGAADPNESASKFESKAAGPKKPISAFFHYSRFAQSCLMFPVVPGCSKGMRKWNLHRFSFLIMIGVLNCMSTVLISIGRICVF